MMVSIITPIYKAENWLDDLFRTIDSQLFRDFEHLLIDDNGTIASFERLKVLVSGRANTRVFSTVENSGPAIARNLGISNARGRYVAFLDADDIWHPNKLMKQVRFMRDPNLAFSYHDYRHMSHDGNLVGDAISGPELLNFRAHHVRRGTGGCLSVMIDRQQLNGFKFPVVDKSFPEDYLAWLNIIELGHVGVRLPEVLGLYRLSSKSRSSNKFQVIKTVWKIYTEFEKIPRLKAFFWWSQYVLSSFLTYRFAKPRLPRRTTIDF